MYLPTLANTVVYKVALPKPHAKQLEIRASKAKRKIIRAGRRGGKTIGLAIIAVEAFLQGRRVLYAAPTQEQIDAFWNLVCAALYEPLEARVLYKNETLHIIQTLDPKNRSRIRAKTAWNANTLRGDYADLLILDEYQLMNEDAWGVVGAPMLLDNDGDAVFIYTPPSLSSRSISKANDPQHAAKMYAKHKNDPTGRWATFSFTSHDNPYISRRALEDLTKDMSSTAYRMEIEAQDILEAPGALWTRDLIERNRADKPEEFDRIVVAIDPSATSTGDEAGIVAAGKVRDRAFILADRTIQGSPTKWAKEAVLLYHELNADAIIAETNNGGEMVELTIRTIDKDVKVKTVTASRGKQTRAEPISAKYEKNKVHHVGAYPFLEDEMCLWTPGEKSPNRMDAMVWAVTDLLFGKGRVWAA